MACTAAECGDGFVAGFEACDDGGQCNGGGGTACTQDADCTSAGDGDACQPRAGDGCGTDLQSRRGLRVPDPRRCVYHDHLRRLDGRRAPRSATTATRRSAMAARRSAPGSPTAPTAPASRSAATRWSSRPRPATTATRSDGDGCSSRAARRRRASSCTEVPLADPPVGDRCPIVIRDFLPTCLSGRHSRSPRDPDTEGSGSDAALRSPRLPVLQHRRSSRAWSRRC